MTTTLCQPAPKSVKTHRFHASHQTTNFDETPYSPYIRGWLTQCAAKHRDLLLNIEAAKKLRRTP